MIYMILLSFSAFLMLQLQLFTLQVLNHDNTFSAKGFTVDARFLTSVNNGS